MHTCMVKNLMAMRMMEQIVVTCFDHKDLVLQLV